MVAVVSIDAELIDHLEGVFAPVPDIYESVVERRSIISSKVVAFTKGPGSSEDIRRDYFFQKTLEFTIRKLHLVQGFESIPEVSFKSRSITNVWAIFVFEGPEFRDQGLFKIAFRGIRHHYRKSLFFI